MTSNATAARSRRALQPNSRARAGPVCSHPSGTSSKAASSSSASSSSQAISSSAGAHPHRHRPDGIGAADRAAQLGQDPVGAEAGGDDPGVEHVRNGAQVHHGAVVAPPRGVADQTSRLAGGPAGRPHSRGRDLVASCDHACSPAEH